MSSVSTEAANALEAAINDIVMIHTARIALPRPCALMTWGQ
jgi:hypothetical protein